MDAPKVIITNYKIRIGDLVDVLVVIGPHITCKKEIIEEKEDLRRTIAIEHAAGIILGWAGSHVVHRLWYD